MYLPDFTIIYKFKLEIFLRRYPEIITSILRSTHEKIYDTTGEKVGGSIPDEIIEISIPSSRTVALGSTQPLAEMSTRGIFLGVKGGLTVKPTISSPSVSLHALPYIDRHAVIYRMY
jgi:hypothetical protein